MNTKTVNTYQIQVGFMAPQTASMLVPAATLEEAEADVLDHINRQFANAVIIQAQLISSEELPEKEGEPAPKETSVIPFSQAKRQKE